MDMCEYIKMECMQDQMETSALDPNLKDLQCSEQQDGCNKFLDEIVGEWLQ